MVIPAGSAVRRAGLVIAVLALCSCGNGGNDPVPSADRMGSTSVTADRFPASQSPDAYALELTEAVDAARIVQGLPALAPSECAVSEATARAAALVGVEELTHAPLDEVQAACDASLAGENLVRSHAPAQDVVEAWLASPGHANNVLSPDYSAHGIGCVADGPELLCADVFLGQAS